MRSLKNAYVRAVRTKNGFDAVCRVLVAGKEGHNALEALRRVAYGSATRFCDSHVLPLLFELQFEDITFGIFPLTSAMDFHDMIPSIYCHCSLGDFMHMFTQALEVYILALHSLTPYWCFIVFLGIAVHSQYACSPPCTALFFRYDFTLTLSLLRMRSSTTSW